MKQENITKNIINEAVDFLNRYDLMAKLDSKVICYDNINNLEEDKIKLIAVIADNLQIDVVCKKININGENGHTVKSYWFSLNEDEIQELYNLFIEKYNSLIKIEKRVLANAHKFFSNNVIDVLYLNDTYTLLSPLQYNRKYGDIDSIYIDDSSIYIKYFAFVSTVKTMQLYHNEDIALYNKILAVIDEYNKQKLPNTVNLTELAAENHQNNINKGWYDNKPSIPELLCMIHSEVSEVTDAYRNSRDEEIGEELADIILRTLDLAAYMKIDIHAAVLDKLSFNKTREYRHGGKKI